MAKKIIIGLIITTVLSLTTFGFVYAYQKENIDPNKKNTEESGVNYYSSTDDEGVQDNLVDGEDEMECPKYEERIRNNYRYREGEGEECGNADTNRNEFQYQHRYENECDGDPKRECDGSGKSIQNQNGNSNSQNNGGNNR